jgi:hypothetical protein
VHTRAPETLKELADGELRLVEVLSESSRGHVWLLSDAEGRKLVVKRYHAGLQRFEKERDFLLCGRRRPLAALYLPEVIDSGPDYLLLEFVPREHLTRETVSARNWTEDDIKLWVEALLEFQELRPRRRAFSVKEQLAGLVYPVARTSEQLLRYGGRLTFRQRLVIVKMLAAYVVQRFLFRNVCTHYDLQTSNYTFMVGKRRMSMLDCEFSYFLGDPYFDILYYVTIPPVRWREWTFERQLLKTFFSLLNGRSWVNKGRENRVRLILLSCNIMRYLHFDDDPPKQRVYWDNICDLLDKGRFEALWRGVQGE